MIKRIQACCLAILICISTLSQGNPVPGSSFRDCSDCPQMIVIPAGSFTIGSPEDELGRFSVEGPMKTVTIKQFAVGRFNVTRGQWAAFVAATNRAVPGGCAWSGLKDSTLKDWEIHPDASWKKLGFPQDDDHPVVCITWFDAQDYVNWLSQKTGGTYRLLTEAEWEYAARAGTTTPYPWGPVASHENANYGLDSGFFIGHVSGRDQWEKTSPVGSFPPNAFGLYDMHGNVLQFVEDCFSESYEDLPTDGSAYRKNIRLKMTGRFSFMDGSNSCSYRICRGGDWANPPAMIRSAFRNWAPGPGGATLQNYRSAGVGFRVAKTL